MSGDWIKMRVDLQTHPKVVRISSALKADRLRVVGGLHAVWCLFDTHSVDGVLDGYTLDTLDAHIGWSGFGCAMVKVGWLIENPESLATPSFEEHNGQSAKRRATETQRKREARLVQDLSAAHADKMRSREEKRREDIYTPPKSAKGTALAQDWKLPEDWREWAAKTRVDIDVDTVAESFRDYWVAKPGKDGRKTDWLATWRNWVRNQKSGIRGQQQLNGLSSGIGHFV